MIPSDLNHARMRLFTPLLVLLLAAPVMGQPLATVLAPMAVSGMVAMTSDEGDPFVLPARDGFPAQPIRFISPFPAGGGNDATTRFVTTRLPEVTGQPAVVTSMYLSVRTRAITSLLWAHL